MDRCVLVAAFRSYPCGFGESAQVHTVDWQLRASGESDNKRRLAARAHSQDPKAQRQSAAANHRCWKPPPVWARPMGIKPLTRSHGANDDAARQREDDDRATEHSARPCCVALQ